MNSVSRTYGMCLFSYLLLPIFFQGDTLDYLGIPGLHLAGSQGVIVIAICQALLMVSINTCSVCIFLVTILMPNAYQWRAQFTALQVGNWLPGIEVRFR